MKKAITIMAMLAGSSALLIAEPGASKPPANTAAAHQQVLPEKAKALFGEADQAIRKLSLDLNKLLIKKDAYDRSVLVVGWQNAVSTQKEAWNAKFSAGMKAMNAEFNKDKMQTEPERNCRSYYMEKWSKTGAVIDHVFGNVGLQVATWKLDYNQNLLCLTELIDTAPSIIDQLKLDLEVQDNMLKYYRESVDEANTFTILNRISGWADTCERVTDSVQKMVDFRLKVYTSYTKEVTPKIVFDGLKKAKKGWLAVEQVPPGSLPADVIITVQTWDTLLPVSWQKVYEDTFKKTGTAYKPLEGDYPPFYKEIALFKDHKISELGNAAKLIRDRIKSRKAKLQEKMNVGKQIRAELKVIREFAEDRRKEAKAAQRRKMPWDDWMKTILDRLEKSDKVSNKSELISKVKKAVKSRLDVLEEWEEKEFIGYDVASLEKRLDKNDVTDKDRQDLLDSLAEAKKREAGFRQKIRELEDEIVRTLEQAQEALDKP